LANGNFSIVLRGLGRADEIGEIAQAVKTFKVNARLKGRGKDQAARSLPGASNRLKLQVTKFLNSVRAA
jgi:hypothetical protein